MKVDVGHGTRGPAAEKFYRRFATEFLFCFDHLPPEADVRRDYRTDLKEATESLDFPGRMLLRTFLLKFQICCLSRPNQPDSKRNRPLSG